MPETREEHIAWCKARALEELDGSHRGAGPQGAAASMLSDLRKHDETIGMLTPDVMMDGIALAAAGDPRKVREWIEGFA